ncbi:MAG: hypothetical protein ACQERR_08560 [Pseudomonadota bacterium]
MNLRALARQYHQGTTDRDSYRKARAELIETALHDSGGDDTTGMNTTGADTAPAPTPDSPPAEKDESDADSESRGGGAGSEGSGGAPDMDEIAPEEATVVATPSPAPSSESSAPRNAEERALPSGHRERQRRLATGPGNDPFRRRLLLLTIVVAFLIILGLTVDIGALLS